jgi:excisionase family DNA binding protein
MEPHSEPVSSRRLPEGAPFTLAEFQARLRLSKGFVAKLVKSGEVPSFTLGRRRFIPAAAVVAMERGQGRAE